MKITQRHQWVTTIEEATTIQQQLKPELITEDKLGEISYIAGVDVGFEQEGTISKAAVVILNFPNLQLQETAIAKRPTSFPYLPGFLSFREIPAVCSALEKINITPDLILCDGQGLAHPLRFGLACHLGVLLDIPTIGVAKSLFIGEYNELPLEKGSWQPLIDQGETIGAVVRTRTDVKPLYVSIGHRISLPTAIAYVLQCTTQYRLPETTRLADHLASHSN